MIEKLDGIFETVNFKEDTALKLYYNNEVEDYPSHWHISSEIIMPTENIYTVETPDQTVVLREGDIAIICPGCIHALYAPDSGTRIIFQPDLASFRFMREVDGLTTEMSPMVVITPEDYPSIYEEVHQMMLDIKEDYFKGDSFTEVAINAKFLHMLTLIGRHFHQNTTNIISQDSSKGEEYFEKFIAICDYIKEHCSEELTLEQVADISGFSKFYFSRLFKQFAKVSFYKYVNQQRIAKAEMLLVDPSNSITDVAMACGFSSLSPFIRMFKLVKGCTPTEFRKMYRSQRPN